ncbi:MAG: heavy-metal-associated domain-containing protein [Sphingobacteriales bacterium]|nr:MAG: heavy-metal-associated domain-containing protein [Sphingobacteriales bacterium]
MKHTYKISGMTCDGCSAKVSYLLKQLPEVNDVAINLSNGEAIVTMDSHVATQRLQDALKEYPKYQLSEKNVRAEMATTIKIPEHTKSWVATYKPILLIFGYVSVISLIAAYSTGAVDIMVAMRIFMAGFFLTFSFFKMLDLKGFAESYAMYDVVARRFKGWGYIYAFTELALGLSFALNFAPIATNAITAIVMTVSLIGVLQSVLNKKKIQCACLGAVFNLPMSTVTIIEDGLMIAMSVGMLAMYL